MARSQFCNTYRRYVHVQLLLDTYQNILAIKIEWKTQYRDKSQYLLRKLLSAKQENNLLLNHHNTGKFCISFYNLWDSTLVNCHTCCYPMRNIYIKQHNPSNLYLSASTVLNFKLGYVNPSPSSIERSQGHLLGTIFFISIDPLTFINPFTISAPKILKSKRDRKEG